MPTKIEIRALGKSFPAEKGPLTVIENVSLTVDDGEFVAIVGPSGCGKSTLLNLMAGFIRPDAGSLAIDGQIRSKPNSKGILISQQGSVFPWLTVRENLAFGLNGHAQSEHVRIADHYAGLVGLQGFEQSYPHELSGGMLKRVELARALAVKPEILYMDEPFSALDALMSLRIRNELLRILRIERHTVILVTHDVEEAVLLTSRVIVLSERPAHITAEFTVDLPYPRHRDNPELVALRRQILGTLGLET